jgi:hypothetical protein
MALPTTQANANFATAKLTVVMGTYYPNHDDERFSLALETLSRYHTLGLDYPVVVVDASPDHEEVAQMFRHWGAMVLDARGNGGIAPQNLLGIQYALDHGATRIMRQEPEKYGLADASILERVVAELNSGTDMLCVGRTKQEGIASLPPVQQHTETVMSRMLARLGLPEDTASGIRAMTRLGAEQMLGFNPEQSGTQWEFLWYCLLDAIRAGLTVSGILVPQIHPFEMVRQETNNPVFDEKRFAQADLIIPKVIAYAQSLGFSLDTSPRSFAI